MGMSRLGITAASAGSRRPMHSRPNPQLAQYMAGQLGSRAVLIFDFAAPRKPGGPVAVRCSAWGDSPEIHTCLQELGMEIVEDIDKGFTETDDLARALGKRETV